MASRSVRFDLLGRDVSASDAFQKFARGLTGTLAKAKAETDEAGRQMEEDLKVKAEADISDVEAKLGKLNDNLERTGLAERKATLRLEEMRKKLEDLGDEADEASKKKVQLQVDEAEANLNRVQRKLRDLNTQRTEVKVDLDTKRAELQAGQLRRWLDEVDDDRNPNVRVNVEGEGRLALLAQRLRDVDEVGGRLGGGDRLAAIAAGIGAIGTAGVGSLGAVGALAGTLANLSGVAAAGPAALVTLGTAMGTVKLASQGVSDALSAQSAALTGGADEAKAYQEALDALPPGARAFVEALQPAQQALQDMRGTLAENFFGAFTGELGRLSPLLGIVRGGMEGMAGTLGRLVKEGVDLAASGPWSASMQRLMDSAQVQAFNYGDAALWAADSLRIIADAGAPLAEHLSRLVNIFSENTNQALRSAEASGQLAAFMDRARQAMDSVFSIAGSVGRALAGLFNAGQESGQRLLDRIAQIAERLANWINSAGGQEALGTFFENGVTFAEGLLSIVEALAPALGPVLMTLSDMAARFGEFAQTNPQVAAIVATIGTLAGLLVANLPAVIGFVTGLATIGTTGIAIGAAIAAVVGVVGALAGVFMLLWTQSAPLRGLLGDLWGQFQRIAGVVGATVMPVLQNWWNLFQTQLLPAFNQAVTAVRDQLRPAFDQLVGAIERNRPQLQAIGNLIVQVAMWIATNLWPILVQVIGWLATNGVQGVSVMIDWLGRFISTISSVWQNVQIAYKNISMYMTQKRQAVGAAIEAVIGFFNRGRAEIDRFVSGIANFVAGARKHFSAFVDSVRERIDTAIGFLRSLPGRAQAAVSGLGSALMNAGRSLIQGLIDGVNDRVGALRSRLGAITSMIPSWKGPESTDRVLLRPAGQAIMDGLIGGIVSRESALRTTLTGVTRTITDSLQAAPDGLAAAAQELLGQLSRGGSVFEDLSFRGMSANLGRMNDALADRFYAANPGLDFGGPASRDALLRFLREQTQPARAGLAGAGLVPITVNVSGTTVQADGLTRLEVEELLARDRAERADEVIRALRRELTTGRR